MCSLCLTSLGFLTAWWSWDCRTSFKAAGPTLNKCPKTGFGTSLVVQWVRLHGPNAGGPGSIPGQGTRSWTHAATKSPHVTVKILCATTKTRCSQKEKTGSIRTCKASYSLALEDLEHPFHLRWKSHSHPRWKRGHWTPSPDMREGRLDGSPRRLGVIRWSQCGCSSLGKEGQWGLRLRHGEALKGRSDIRRGTCGVQREMLALKCWPSPKGYPKGGSLNNGFWESLMLWNYQQRRCGQISPRNHEG